MPETSLSSSESLSDDVDDVELPDPPTRLDELTDDDEVFDSSDDDDDDLDNVDPRPRCRESACSSRTSPSSEELEDEDTDLERLSEIEVFLLLIRDQSSLLC